MKLEDLLSEAKEILKTSGVHNYKFEAEYILSQILCKDRLSLHLDFNEELPLEDVFEVLDTVDIRATDKIPVQYIFGQANFYGRNFKVDKNVLIPRPETELLVEKVIEISKKFSNPRILEIGSGSGAAAITVALENQNALVTSVDISSKAIEISKVNQEKYGSNVVFSVSDLFSNVTGTYDIIFSNPPYISEEEYKTLSDEVKKEPKSALIAKDNGLYFYNKIVELASAYKEKDSYLIFAIGSEQGKDVRALLSDYKFVSCIKDYNKHDRIIIATN